MHLPHHSTVHANFPTTCLDGALLQCLDGFQWQANASETNVTFEHGPAWPGLISHLGATCETTETTQHCEGIVNQAFDLLSCS